MLLKKGDVNEDVKKLQIKLGVEPIGTFGPKTEIAVKAWQKQNGLDDDGVVGDNTWEKLFPPIIVQPVTVVPAIAIVPTPVTISSTGAAIISVQNLSRHFKLDKLKGHIPDSVIAAIPDTAAKFNITNTLRLAHFLAQAGHESGQFKATSENLNYSSKGLLGIFPKYFNAATAESYARKPEMIASKVYGGRMGNGAEATKDGYKFRGRGYIQLTGKDNYTQFDKTVPEDILANPDLVATKYALMSAAWFFDKNKLWSICDKGADQGTVTAVTKRVNGGTIGLPDRIKHFNEYYNLLK
jgi:putative chitinase